MLAVAHTAVESGVRLPNELTLLGKTLLNLDEVGQTLAPDFDVQESLRRNANELMMERMRRSVTPSSAFSALLEAKNFAERLPSRVNRILDSLANQELKVRVEMIDEGAVMEGLQKVANRIALGVVLAAMIVGAAMLRRIEFFLAAIAISAGMVLWVLRTDRRSKRPT
jgi:predicted unusual protein kinase regulating ubiquinone biosynthesis (AarF/ABC1/UbiB family)